MPPQKSLIAELLTEETKVEQAERGTSLHPKTHESSYYNLDLYAAVSLMPLVC